MELERWQSGRMQHTANVLALKGAPGFKSLPLRQMSYFEPE